MLTFCVFWIGIPKSVYGQIAYTIWADEATFLIDSTSAFQIDDVTKSARFTEIKQSNITFGYVPYPTWFRFVTIALPRDDNYIFALGNELLENIEVYVFREDGGRESFQIGSSVHAKDKPFFELEAGLPIRAQKGEILEIFVRVKSKSLLTADFSFIGAEKRSKILFWKVISDAFFMGVLFFALFYNLIVWWIIRDQTYLYYVGYVFFYGLSYFLLIGWVQLFLFPSLSGFVVEFHSVGLCLAGITMLLFTNSFLKTRENLQWFYTVLVGVIGVLLFGIILIPIKVHFSFQLLIWMNMLTSPLLIVGAIIIYKQGNPYGRLYIIAKIFALMGLASNFLVTLSILPPLFIFLDAHRWTSILEVILFSLALAERIKMLTIEKEREHSQFLLEKIRADEAEYLARTAELQAKTTEMQARIIQEENDRKGEELERARMIQTQLLPKLPPFHNDLEIGIRYETATEVGGDYYDFFEQPDGSLYIVVGDATGHGLPASLMVTMTKSALSFIEPKSPSILLAQLNEGLKNIRLSRLTMALAVIKYQNGIITIASAGMPPIYKLSANGIEEIMISGTPLGAIVPMKYKEHEINLDSGETLVIFSDGLPESSNEENDAQMGFEVILNELAAHRTEGIEEILDALIKKEKSFRSQNLMEDDITIVGIQRR